MPAQSCARWDGLSRNSARSRTHGDNVQNENRGSSQFPEALVIGQPAIIIGSSARIAQGQGEQHGQSAMDASAKHDIGRVGGSHVTAEQDFFIDDRRH